ncbi:MAG: hypothetical protein AAF974_12165 [Cyanobacteria bacterium P01_E01_bin.34]
MVTSGIHTCEVKIRKSMSRIVREFERLDKLIASETAIARNCQE